MADRLIGKDELNPLHSPKTQVFYATHKLNREGEAWERLSLMKRSFISFSYGGKFIEDFNLIAVIIGDRIQRNSYGSFEDSTTSYSTVDGQFYWGSNYTNNSLSFVLATDGITEAELNEFRRWFAPGQNKELYLAENPNRGIMARVSSTPVYSLLPFEKKTSVIIGGFKYNTSITLYKGEINLSFVMDDPFWYSRASLIDYFYTNEEDKIDSMTQDTSLPNLKETLKDKDFIKIIIEDNIPHVEMLATEALLSDNMYAMVHGNNNGIYSQIVGTNILDPENYYAHIDNTPIVPRLSGMVGVILGSVGDASSSISINSSTPRYLYYSGTAPSDTIIQFTLTPHFNSNNFIDFPFNSYTSVTPYNTLTIGSSTMAFTIPSIYTGYNQAVSIIKNFSPGDAITEVEDAIKLGVNEYYSRKWAINCINTLKQNSAYVSNNMITASFANAFISEMKKLFVYGNTTKSATFSFNSKTGEVIGIFTINNGNNANLSITMSCGDMMRSEFIKLKDRNYPNANGNITNNECTEISTDCSSGYGGLTNLLVTFKNMYL